MMLAPALLAGLAGAAAAQNAVLKEILTQAGTGNFTYPTSITQDIVPKQLHSHNDYWRPVPFYSALAAGCVSVEADVWLVNGQLYVGHEPDALTFNRTFDSLYIQPILSVLNITNSKSPFVNFNFNNGVFDTDSGQTLYLWVDVKIDGEQAWPVVVKALEPLRAAGYLTTYDGKTVKPGPVTIIGTGNTPLDQVQGAAPRDFFSDANVANLTGVTKEVSPIASGDFASIFGSVRNTALSAAQLKVLRQQVKAAHDKGIQVRYWDMPGWPIGTRNALWRTLWDEGVDLINVDDIEAAAGLWEME